MRWIVLFLAIPFFTIFQCREAKAQSRVSEVICNNGHAYPGHEVIVKIQTDGKGHFAVVTEQEATYNHTPQGRPESALSYFREEEIPVQVSASALTREYKGKNFDLKITLESFAPTKTHIATLRTAVLSTKATIQMTCEDQ